MLLNLASIAYLDSKIDGNNFNNNKSTILEPKIYKEAITNLNKDKWLKSMELELNSLKDNNT